MTSMWDMLAGLSSQLRWAADGRMPELANQPSTLVVGMGGSGVAGDYAAPIAAQAGVLLQTHKSYDLPGWAAGTSPLVIAVSYSGDTEETLSCVEAAMQAELQVAAVTTGGELAARAEAGGWPLVTVPNGLQPRAALGYLVGSVLRLVETAHGLKGVRPALGEAADVIDELFGSDFDGPGAHLAADLAEGLASRIVLVYGAEGATSAVAGRWKTQVNENGKAPAFASRLPELDHNEVAGWSALSHLTNRVLGVVMLRDPGEHARVRRRFEITRQVMSKAVPVVGEVHARGESLLARMMSLTAIGDALSIYLAEAAGVDPVPVEAIEELKLLLRGDS